MQIFVNSSNIEFVGHSNKGGGSFLLVQFKSKKDEFYVYDGVSKKEAEALAFADSAGRHFAQEIKDKYEFTLHDMSELDSFLNTPKKAPREFSEEEKAQQLLNSYAISQQIQGAVVFY